MFLAFRNCLSQAIWALCLSILVHFKPSCKWTQKNATVSLPLQKRFRRDMWNSDEMSEMSVSIFCCNRKPFETFWQLLIFCMGNPPCKYTKCIFTALMSILYMHASMHLYYYLQLCKKGHFVLSLGEPAAFCQELQRNRCPFRLTGPCRAKWRAGVISSCQKMAVTRLHMPVGRWVSADNYIKEGIKERGVLQSTVAPANPWR